MNLFKKLYILLIFAFLNLINAQTPLYNGIPVSDVGDNNNIGQANTSRNVVIDSNGTIYVVFVGSEGVRVSKSADRGQSFSPSVQVSTLTNVEPEITVNESGVVFVAWIEESNIILKRSVDGGNTFSSPIFVGIATFSGFENAVHMATFDSNIYLVDTVGNNVYSNSNNGLGSFNHNILPNFVYADILTDQNGLVFAPRDNPTLELFFSSDSGLTFTNLPLSPGGQVFFSSYSFSDGPCGRFIFVAGSGSLGYKIDVDTGLTTEITFGDNSLTATGRTLFSDNQGTLIDGFQNASGELVMNVSFNQGDTFTTPIIISSGTSHNLARSDFYDDIVVVYSQNGQIFLSVYDNLLKSIEIDDSILPINVCAGASFDIPFFLTGAFDPNTTFNVQLSDENGSFINSTIIGSLVTNSNGTITCTLPSNIPNSDQYRLLVDSFENCTQSEPININVNSPNFISPSPLMECENEMGEAIFDLSSQNSIITDNQIDFSVTYYLTENDASSKTNEIPNSNNFLIDSNTTVWARMESISNNQCFIVLPIDLILNPLPVVNDASLTQCDIDANNVANFNLNLAQPQISINFSNEFFTYFNTLLGAEMNTSSDQIDNPNNYMASQGDVVYVRVTTSSNCFRTARLDLNVDVGGFPIGFSPMSLEQCDDNSDGDAYNGITAFDLTNTETEIRNAYPLAIRSDLEINFYQSLIDAEMKTNEIINRTNFENINSPNTQSLWVRIDDSIDNNDCRGLVELTNFLTVYPIPVVNQLSPLEECSDNSNAIFNLEERFDEINNGQLHPLRIDFYDQANNLITNVRNYNSEGETIFVRAQFDVDGDGNDINDFNDCISYNEMNFQLVVLQNPSHIITPKAQAKCSDQVSTLYNLLDSEAEILNGDNSLTLNYYETLGPNAGNLISEPSSYTSNLLFNTILVEATAQNGCTSTVNLELITTLFENYNTSPIILEECEIDTNGIDVFNLTRVEENILNGLNAENFNFHYFLLEAEADTFPVQESLAISNPISFENTSNPQTIYVRVSPNNSSEEACYKIIPVTLQVNSVPQIDIEPKYVICLNSAGEVINPLNETFLPDSIIDTHLDSSLYSFQWFFGTEQEVIENPNSTIILNETNSTFAPKQEGFYTVIATDNFTRCTIPATTEVVGSYPPESVEVSLTSEAFSGVNNLMVTVIGNGNYEYSLDHGAWQANPEFTNITGGEHLILVRDLYNCNLITLTKSIIDYPRFFTPNNDGFKDTWNIKSISSQPNAKIFVYNRFGKLLKQLDPRGRGWDGTYRGAPQPVDDYWFTVEYIEPLTNVVKKFKSHFALKR